MKNDLLASYHKLEEKAHTLTFSERALITGAGAVMLLALIDTIIMQPMVDARLAAERQQLEAQTESTSLQARLTELESQIEMHPSSRAARHIDDLRQRDRRMDEEINSITGNLIAPQSMPRVLSEMLSDHSGLDIINVQSSPAEKVMVADGQQQRAPSLYRHNLELTMKGSFFQVTDYLQAIEALPSRLIWDELDYNVSTYPEGTLSLRVHTLSTGEDLIRVTP